MKCGTCLRALPQNPSGSVLPRGEPAKAARRHALKCFETLRQLCGMNERRQRGENLVPNKHLACEELAVCHTGPRACPRLPQGAAPSFLGQRRLDGLHHLCGIRFDLGLKPLEDLAVAAHEKFGEIPANVSRDRGTRPRQ